MGTWYTFVTEILSKCQQQPQRARLDLMLKSRDQLRTCCLLLLICFKIFEMYQILKDVIYMIFCKIILRKQFWGFINLKICQNLCVCLKTLVGLWSVCVFFGPFSICYSCPLQPSIYTSNDNFVATHLLSPLPLFWKLVIFFQDIVGDTSPELTLNTQHQLMIDKNWSKKILDLILI